MTQKNIILIGGAPTSGKSTLAKSLSTKLNIPYISTDQIREIMWSCADESKYPKLFNTHNYTAEEFYTKYTPEQVVQKEIEQAEDVWESVKYFINNDYTWNDGYIIEGVAILPHLIKDMSNSGFKILFLVDKDEERIRQVIYKRGLWAGAKSYSDDVKEKEVEYVKIFNDLIINECIKYGFETINMSKSEKDLESINL